MERDQAIELLESNHEFPGPFQFRVVVRPADRTSTVSAMSASVGDATVLDIEERASRNGTYIALHVRMQLERAEQVLDVYEVLGQLPGVLAKM